MSGRAEPADRHLPSFFNDNPIRRLLLPPRRVTRPFVAEGQVVADIGCGPGFCTLELAEIVGPRGRVYAVDVDDRPLRAVELKAARLGYRNIEAHAASAADLRFIPDGSVDFVLAHGLLCSMAPQHHQAAVSEMRRILAPGGRAYLSVARGPWSYVGAAEWERILTSFEVLRRGEGFPWLAHRWALVSRGRA